MKKSKRTMNQYTKWCYINNTEEIGLSPADLFWDSNANLIGDEEVVNDEINEGKWTTNKLRSFAKHLDIDVLHVEDDGYCIKSIFPVYSYRLNRKQNLSLIKAFLNEGSFCDPAEFLWYHQRDLTELLGKKAYRRLCLKAKRSIK